MGYDGAHSIDTGIVSTFNRNTTIRTIPFIITKFLSTIVLASYASRGVRVIYCESPDHYDYQATDCYECTDSSLSNIWIFIAEYEPRYGH